MLRGINRQDIFEEAVRITNHSPLIYSGWLVVNCKDTKKTITEKNIKNYFF